MKPAAKPLTAAQRAACELLERGFCDKQIADELGITRRTVQQRLAGAAKRFGVLGRVGLAVQFAFVRRGLDYAHLRILPTHGKSRKVKVG